MLGHGVSLSVNRALALSRDNMKVQAESRFSHSFHQQNLTFCIVYSTALL